MSVTESVVPGARLGPAGVVDAVVSSRSDLVTVTAPEVATAQLLPSLLSSSVFRSSAQARRKYVLSAVAAGIVRVTVPELLAPIARPGTDRVAVSIVSPASLPPSSER